MNDKKDYRRLVDDLRACAKNSCGNCSYAREDFESDCYSDMKTEAASAIETLLNDIETYRQEAVRAKMELDATKKELKSARREWHDAKSDPPKILGKYLVALYDSEASCFITDTLWFEEHERWCDVLHRHAGQDVIYWSTVPSIADTNEACCK